MTWNETEKLSICLYIYVIRKYCIRFSRPNSPESYWILLFIIEAWVKCISRLKGYKYIPIPIY